MKKNHIKIVSALGLIGGSTALLAPILLTSCAEQHSPVVSVTFSCSEGQMTSSINGSLELNWTPSDHSLEFSNWKFTYNGNKQVNSIVVVDPSSRPQQLNITFNEDIISNIADGKLSFHCKDVTANIEFDKTVESIAVTGYTFDHYSVNMAADSKGITLKSQTKITPGVEYTNELNKPQHTPSNNKINVEWVKHFDSQTHEAKNIGYGDNGYKFDPDNNALTISSAVQITGFLIVKATLINISDLPSQPLEIDYEFITGNPNIISNLEKKMPIKFMNGNDDVTSLCENIEAKGHSFTSKIDITGISWLNEEKLIYFQPSIIFATGSTIQTTVQSYINEASKMGLCKCYISFKYNNQNYKFDFDFLFDSPQKVW